MTTNAHRTIRVEPNVGHASGPLSGQTNTDTFTYDRAGRMLTGIKGRYSNTITFSYDDRGQQTQETLTTHGQTYTVGYQKNVLGQTTQLAYPDGSLVDRTYSNRGQLASVNYTPTGGAASSVAAFTYDAGGRETSRALGNGLTTTRAYFADNQIQSIATPTVETLTYTYDANKNPTSESRSGVMAPYSWSTGTTGYDHEDRLTNWSRTNGDSQSWNLSPVHDWTSTVINGSTQTRTHGPAHEILTMAGAGVSPSPATLTHDTKGNMTLDDRGCGMAWDFDNMLQSFTANGVSGLSNATYEYDAIGRRVAKNVAQAGGGAATTLFAQAGQQVTCEYTPGTAVTDCDRKYAYGSYIDEVLNFVDASGAAEARYWLHQNRQYSNYATTSSAGTVAERLRYDAYGKHFAHAADGTPLSAGAATVCSVTFTGRSHDVESNCCHFRSRIIVSQSGRFCSRDPLATVDGPNLYRVMRCNTTRFLDPFGTITITNPRIFIDWDVADPDVTPGDLPPNDDNCEKGKCPCNKDNIFNAGDRRRIVGCGQVGGIIPGDRRIYISPTSMWYETECRTIVTKDTTVNGFEERWWGTYWFIFKGTFTLERCIDKKYCWDGCKRDIFEQYRDIKKCGTFYRWGRFRMTFSGTAYDVDGEVDPVKIGKLIWTVKGMF